MILRFFFFCDPQNKFPQKRENPQNLIPLPKLVPFIGKISFSVRNKSLGQDVFVIDWHRLPCFTDLSVLFHLSITDLDNYPIKRDFKRQLKNAEINAKQEKTAFHNLKNYCSRGIKKDLPIRKNIVTHYKFNS